MTYSSRALVFAIATLAVVPTAGADTARTIVWLTAQRSPGDAVRIEAEAAGYTLVVADAPTGDDGGARLANARARGRVLGGTFTVYVELDGVPTVFVIAEDGTIAHAPLSSTRFSERALALVAMSLVDELGERPALVSLPETTPGDEAPEASAPAAPAPAQTTPDAAPPSSAQSETPAQTPPVLDTTSANAPATAPVSPTAVAGDADPSAMPAVVVIDAPPGSEVHIDVRPPATPDGVRVIPFGADFVPFVGFSSFTRGHAIRRFSLNVLAGFDHGIEGFELGGIANLHRADVAGVQIAGVLNGIGGDVDGVQLAGIANYAGGDIEGAQLAGSVNIARGDLHGIQSAPANFIGGHLHGVQMGVANVLLGDALGGQLGLANYTLGRVDGVQAGLLNIARDVGGAQVGLANISRGEVHGAQVGLANIARGDVGGQVGLANVAVADARFQLGLLNVSDDADFALGPINIVRHGRTELELLGNDGGFVFAGLKHGGRHFHSIYSLGVNPFEDDPLFAIGLGYGGRITPTDRLHIDIDGVAHLLVDSETRNARRDIEAMQSARVTLGYRVLRHLGITVGASYDLLVTKRDGRTEGFGLIDAHVHQDRVATGGFRLLGWPSLMVGLTVL